MIPEDKKKVVDGFLKLFSIKGRPANEQLTPSQKYVFYVLVFQPSKRVHIITPTQFGKSLVTALACIILSAIKGEIVAVVAPTSEKAKIIMRYYIEHLGDNPLFYTQLDKDTKLERLRQEESKERIILRNGGGIYSLSVNQRSFTRSIESAMGMGAKNTIQDESCLIRDDTEATIFRMIGGEGSDAFYAKIGNPFYRQPPYSHFYKSSRDPNYLKVFIDYHTALEEGRYTPEFIEEAKKKPYFDVLFECKFPSLEAIDAHGYSPLVTEKDLEYLDQIQIFGEERLGIDVAGGGGDKGVIVERGDNGARVLYSSFQSDTMQLVAKALEYKKKLGILTKNIFVDTIGVGQGVADRLDEQLEGSVTRVNFGGKPEYEEKFMNLKAQCYWRAAEWIKGVGKLERHIGFDEALDQRYKVQSDKVIRVKSKDELLREGIPSPDHWDALALTFARSRDEVVKKSYVQPPYQPISRYEGI